MSLWARWAADRALRRRAAAFARQIRAEPQADDVQWLAARVPGHDADHARWELRYARRALGLLVAQRDALDDRTASAVAQALVTAAGRDRAVAPDKIRVAERQFNARVKAYRETLARRQDGPTSERLGATLLGFAGDAEVRPEDVARAGSILSRYVTGANEALRTAFGAASLPEHLPPSALVRAKRVR